MLEYPVKFWAENTTGELDFGLRLAFEKSERWTVSLRHGSAEVKYFDCKSDGEWCRKVKKYLEDGLPKEVFTLDAVDDWTQPQASRQLLGFIKYLNHFAHGQFETFHAMATDTSLSMFFNCKADSALDALK